MAVINPNENPDLRLSLDLKDNEDGTISVKNVTYFDDTVALKMSAIYKIEKLLSNYLYWGAFYFALQNPQNFCILG